MIVRGPSFVSLSGGCAATTPWDRPAQISTILQQVYGAVPHMASVLSGYFFIRITPTPIVLRSHSEYFKRAFSAAAFVLNGLDSGVNPPSTYL
jgi:hypothetical protein